MSVFPEDAVAIASCPVSYQDIHKLSWFDEVIVLAACVTHRNGIDTMMRQCIGMNVSGETSFFTLYCRVENPENDNKVRSRLLDVGLFTWDPYAEDD